MALWYRWTASQSEQTSLCHFNRRHPVVFGNTQNKMVLFRNKTISVCYGRHWTTFKLTVYCRAVDSKHLKFVRCGSIRTTPYTLQNEVSFGICNVSSVYRTGSLKRGNNWKMCVGARRDAVNKPTWYCEQGRPGAVAGLIRRDWQCSSGNCLGITHGFLHV
jgi:hypothetical protein